MSAQRIVVGIDGSQCSRRALHWALSEAELRNADVDVVHAWEMPVAFGTIPGEMAYDTTALEEAARATVDEMVAAAQQPGVRVEKIVTYGPAAATLLEAAKGADLVVVGSRGRGGFTGLLLGSVGQAVAHHAPCPVVIVR